MEWTLNPMWGGGNQMAWEKQVKFPVSYLAANGFPQTYPSYSVSVHASNLKGYVRQEKGIWDIGYRILVCMTAAEIHPWTATCLPQPSPNLPMTPPQIWPAPAWPEWAIGMRASRHLCQSHSAWWQHAFRKADPGLAAADCVIHHHKPSIGFGCLCCFMLYAAFTWAIVTLVLQSCSPQQTQKGEGESTCWGSTTKQGLPGHLPHWLGIYVCASWVCCGEHHCNTGVAAGNVIAIQNMNCLSRTQAHLKERNAENSSVVIRRKVLAERTISGPYREPNSIN